jgi:16S rRNA (uracil1498-N3)-methyltransferase
MRPRFFVDVTVAGLPVAAADLPAASAALLGVEVSLSAGDAHHARRVLRARPGDECELVLEPVPVLLRAVFVAVGDDVMVRIEEVCPASEEGRVQVALVQALPDPRKVDEIVEKGTEVGADLFLIVSASASPSVPIDRLVERATRWRRIAREAAKQSRRLSIPMVEVAPSFAAARAYLDAGGWTGLVLDPTTGYSTGHAFRTAVEAVAQISKPARVALWVGPESGWSEAELTWFEGGKLPVVSLGREVLRTETAGPIGAAVCRFALGDWEYTQER